MAIGKDRIPKFRPLERKVRLGGKVIRGGNSTGSEGDSVKGRKSSGREVTVIAGGRGNRKAAENGEYQQEGGEKLEKTEY